MKADCHLCSMLLDGVEHHDRVCVCACLYVHCLRIDGFIRSTCSEAYDGAEYRKTCLRSAKQKHRRHRQKVM